MPQEIEIEFKNIVTEADFHKLIEAFSLKETDFAKQTNFYFDTRDFKIKATGSALRIREKQGEYTLTLKQPHTIGLLETHQTIIEAELLQAQQGHFPEGEVSKQLESLKVSISECLYLGSLTTNRAEIPYKNGTLVLDQSCYFETKDFELEYEVKDEVQGKKDFLNLLHQYNIPFVKTENKIKRFFEKWKER
ncbi:MAG: CYTH domain-containing protein [Bacillaceae bacterium]|nr:CYTH domain-containing protein [Bacillaceae bacterium]